MVNYGFHLGEKFALEVGRRFRVEKIPYVAVISWGKRKRRQLTNTKIIRSYEQWKRDVGAKYVIDLHDNSLYLEYPGSQGLHQYFYNISYDLTFHAKYSDFQKIVYPFMKKWNKTHSERKVIGSACDCNIIDTRRRQCNSRILSLEFLLYKPMKIVEGTEFLKSLVFHLHSL